MNDNAVRRRVSEEFDKRRIADEAAYSARLAELSASVPGFAELTEALKATGLKLYHCAIKGGDLDGVRRETEALREKRRELLVSAGYPSDYADRKYRCEKCSDSGFVGLDMCSCLRRELTMAALDESGLGKLVRRQSFDNFSLDYYDGRDKAIMKANVVV